MSMWVIEALRWLRSQLKRVPGLRKAVQATKQKLGLQTNEYNQWGRIVMNQETDRLIRSLDCDMPQHSKSVAKNGKASASRHIVQWVFPITTFAPGTLDEKFDIIIVEQAFEHLLWPYRAARNVFQMLNPEGALLVTTPFLVKIHNSPVDCSRWTEVGLRHLLAEGGFDINRYHDWVMG